MWLIILYRTIVDSMIFYEGVSWETWRKVGFSVKENELWDEFNKHGEDYIGLSWDEFRVQQHAGYEIVVDDIPYIIPAENCSLSYKQTRVVNEAPDVYAAKKREDKTTDYYKRVKEELGIDMKINHAPQYRDGIKPERDNGDNQTFQLQK